MQFLLHLKIHMLVLRNPIFDGVIIDISQPSTSSLPSYSTSSLSNFEYTQDAEDLTDVDLTPRPKPISLDMENPFE